jgi:hypothetical protein
MLNFDKINESINDFYNRIWTKKTKKFLKLLLFLIIVIGIFYEISSIIALNDYFSVKYNNEIKPKSELEITNIVTEVKPIQNVTDKLNTIAGWEMDNFTDPYFARYLNQDLDIKSLNPPLPTYLYDNSGKIRADFLSPYNNDPDWIQFYKFGACGEEASLFANVTNRSGYPTRIITVMTGFWFYGIPIPQDDHAWVEVNINNEWYFFDPTAYGEYHDLKIDGYKNRWFGKPEDYDLFLPDQILSITQSNTQTDASQRYPKLVSPYLTSYKLLW